MGTTSQPRLRRSPLASGSLGTEDSREELPSHRGTRTVYRPFPELGSEAGDGGLPGPPCGFVVWEGAEWVLPAASGFRPLARSLFLQPRPRRSRKQAAAGSGTGGEAPCGSGSTRERPAQTPAGRPGHLCRVLGSGPLVHVDAGLAGGAACGGRGRLGKEGHCSLAVETKSAQSPAEGPSQPRPGEDAALREVSAFTQEISCELICLAPGRPPPDGVTCVVFRFPRAPGALSLSPGLAADREGHLSRSVPEPPRTPRPGTAKESPDPGRLCSCEPSLHLRLGMEITSQSPCLSGAGQTVSACWEPSAALLLGPSGVMTVTVERREWGSWGLGSKNLASETSGVRLA